jgi:hypothetical protein
MKIEDCIHGLTESTCSICKSKGSPTVFFSAGGRKYHFDVSCRTFDEGRRKVRDDGGVNAPIESGPEYLVKINRDPCRNCRT